MISPNKELFVWGPIDGRPIYTSYFMAAIQKNLPAYGCKWPELILYFIKTKVTGISDFTELRDAGKKSFNRWFMNDKNLRQLKKMYDKKLNNLRGIQGKITLASLNSLSEKKFKNLFLKWRKNYLDYWGIALVPELANWGGEQILKEKLRNIISNESEFFRAFEKLSAPEDYSFYQKEELNLLKIKERQKNKEIFNQLLRSHSKEYFWISNSYFEQKILDHNYFKRRLDEVKNSEARIKIGKIRKIPAKTLNQKRLISKEYSLDKDIIKIAKRLSYSIWWQDARKQQIFTANHYIDLFLKQISKRVKIRFLDLKFYSEDEIASLISGGRKIQNLGIRKKLFLIHYYNNGLKYESGKKILRKIGPFVKKRIDKRCEIKGLLVSLGAGNAAGKVRILLTPRNAHKMKKGEILVAPMTSPDYVVAMRKAAAIVTDEGGMTSHAAIISRELGIPCIVGTKIATKALKNGMLVEVDVGRGIIRKIK